MLGGLYIETCLPGGMGASPNPSQPRFSARQSIAFFTSVVIIALNFTDLAYGWFDPRIGTGNNP
jgi:hypothetical protein